MRIRQKLTGLVGRSRKKEKLKKGLEERSDKIEKGLSKLGNADLDILLQYAKDNFILIKESTEYIEKKADDLIKYLVAGVGFLVGLLGFLIKSFPSHHLNSIGWAIVGGDIVLWFMAIVLALMARRPSSYLYPSNLDSLLSILEKKPNGNNLTALRIEIIQNYELAAEDHLTLSKGKSSKLRWSYNLSVIALFFFVGFVLLFSLSSPVVHRASCFLVD